MTIKWIFTQPPVAEAWDTKELPPVGTVCEVLYIGKRKWQKCEIVAHVKGFSCWVAIYQMEADWSYSRHPENFRPIQNDRDKAVEDMINLYVQANMGAEAGMAALYDAGWRRQ